MTGYGPGYGPFARPYFAAVLLVNSYNYSSSLWLFHYRATLVDHLDFLPPPRVRLTGGQRTTSSIRSICRSSPIISPSPRIHLFVLQSPRDESPCTYVQSRRAQPFDSRRSRQDGLSKAVSAKRSERDCFSKAVSARRRRSLKAVNEDGKRRLANS